MAELYYLPQFKQVNLVAPAGITAVQTSGIKLSNVDGIDKTKPGIICLTWALALDTSVAEWASYTSIDANDELVGVIRGAEGFSAKAHLSNAVIAWTYSKSHINNINTDFLVQHNSDGTHKSELVTTLKTTGATINTGTDDATIVTPKAIADSYLSNGYNSLYRQAIINGNFDVWQRGTSFTTATGAYFADRWTYYDTGTSRTVTRDTDVPNNTSLYSQKMVVVTGGTNKVIDIGQRIEGQIAGRFAGKSITMSFWVKGSVGSGTINNCLVALQYASALENWTTSENTTVSPTFTTTGSWTKISFTQVLPATSASGYSLNNGLSIAIQFGASDSTTLTVNLTQVQLCAGDVALPFMPKSFEEELRMCLRYYEKSYDYGTAIATNTAVGVVDLLAASISSALNNVSFKVRKRTTPVIAYYSIAGTASKISLWSDGMDKGATVTSVFESESGIRQANDSGAGLTSGVHYLAHWTASSEL